MRKKFCAVILVVFAAVCWLTLPACGTPEEELHRSPIEIVYARAQELGFEGTLEEFLAIVAGEDGKPGKDGEKGADGKSAYELAKESGFTGTEAEWLESLRGDEGNAGASGTDGRSAYELAKEFGFTGTEAEWLESLQGLDGNTPYIGENGNWWIGKEDTSVYARPEEPDFDFLPVRNGAGTITGYAVGAGRSRYAKWAEIPASYRGKPIVKIAYRGFEGCRDMTIVIPAGVTEFDYDAFAGAERIAFSYPGTGEITAYGTFSPANCTVDSVQTWWANAGVVTGIPVEVDLTFDAGQGTLTGSAKQVFRRNVDKVLPEPDPAEGSYFYSWKCSECGQLVREPEDVFCGGKEITLTAQYRPVEAMNAYGTFARYEDGEIVAAAHLGDEFFYVDLSGTRPVLTGGVNVISYDPYPHGFERWKYTQLFETQDGLSYTTSWTEGIYGEGVSCAFTYAANGEGPADDTLTVDGNVLTRYAGKQIFLHMRGDLFFDIEPDTQYCMGSKLLEEYVNPSMTESPIEYISRADLITGRSASDSSAIVGYCVDADWKVNPESAMGAGNSLIGVMGPANLFDGWFRLVDNWYFFRPFMRVSEIVEDHGGEGAVGKALFDGVLKEITYLAELYEADDWTLYLCEKTI